MYMKKLTICLFVCLSAAFLHAESNDAIDYIENPFKNQSKIATPTANQNEALEQNLATLGGEPSSIVNGCVNAITGAFIESEVDLWIPGPDPLAVQRVYTNTGGWSINQPEMVQKHNSVTTYIQKGMTATFSKHKDIYKVRAENYRKGLTNCSANSMSGRTNPHNLTMTLENKHFTLHDGSKTVKHFALEIPVRQRVDEYETQVYTGYGLDYEQKPNGIRTVYSYQNSPLGWTIQNVLNINSKSQPLNWIKFDYDNFKLNPRMVAYANDGQSGHCEYKFTNSHPRLLQQVLSTQIPETHYEYNSATGFMKRKICPENRLVEIDYYDEANPYLAVKDKEHTHYGRVFCIRAPVGKDSQLFTTHRFFYEIYKKSNKFDMTHVFDICDQETRYSYDADQHLRSIEEIGPNARTYKIFWYGKDTQFDGNLMTKTIEDPAGKIYSCRHYIYDKNGNVVQDWLFGNLTGRNQSNPVINAIGAPVENGCERYLKRCTYSDDGYNHLLSEEDGRKIIQYMYIPKSDFLRAKFIADLTGKVRQREFYTYNINGSVTRIATDDGSSTSEDDSSITERHIIYIHYRDQFPIGLPQVIEEKYLDLSTQKEKLLKKIENFHDCNGRIVQQDHYDAKGKFRYSLKWEYDAHGNLLKEVDPLGHASSYAYDANDNLIIEQHPGDPFYTRHEYDYSNRLIRSEDVHPSFTLSVRYEYNLLGQKVAAFDWFGHETNFTYDRLGRVIKTTHPSVYGEGRISESCEYDIADNPILKVDARGYRTDVLYNVRGQPCAIHYHDGSVEKNEYTIDGLLEKSIALNGTMTHIDYDYLGRPCKKTIYAPDGALLSESFAYYNSFHKLFDIDPAGHRTDYQYDNAGRLISIKKGDAKTCYQYDACQRIVKVLEYFGPGQNDYVAKVQDYDEMDRVVEERTEDAEGKILTRMSYVYNERGERIQSISYHQSSPSITETRYHAYGDIEAVTDPEGNTTRTHFYYGFINSHGEYVFAKETIDPLGNSIFLENDPLGRLKYEIRKDTSGKITQKREFCYDPAGNCIKQVEHVITPKQSDRIAVHIFEYDSNQNLTKWIEAAGTPEQKLTYYVYNPYRQKTKVIKSDGIELQHTYDWLGRLSTFKGSDSSFHYQYTYDANSNIIRVDDIKNDTVTCRSFDANNRLVKETLANGLTIQYTYDSLARPLQITLPDASTIQYKYDSLHLSKIQRGPYTHTYQNYNQSGLLKEAQMIGKAGKVTYTIDSCRRLTGIKTPVWKEQIPSGGIDKAGNLVKKNTTDTKGTVKGIFAYDSLYQLKSESGVSSHNYQYDSLFNLIKKDKKPHQINSLNQLLHDGYEKSIYDVNGNLIKKGNFKFTYDALDRLISVVDGDSKITYSYDELNRRLRSNYSDNGQTKCLRYLYQGHSEIGACDETGAMIQLRVLGLGKGAEMGAAVLLELEGEVYAPVHDISGNVCALLDPEDGNAVETYRYTAFGEEKLFDAASRLIHTSKNPWRFASKRTDPETAFVYFGQRYYNPETARWVTADPLGLAAGPNFYTYLFNNPLNHFDFYGLEKCFGEDQFSHHRRREEANRRQDNTMARSDSGEKTSSFLDYACDFASVPGKIIYHFFHDCIPIPLLKDLAFIGHVLKGKSPDSYTMSYREKHSYYRLVGKGTQSNYNLVCFNGICVTADEAEQRAMEWYNAFDGKYDTYVSYNATHGFASDLFECLGQMIALCTHATEVAKECLQNATTAIGDYGMTFLNCHSQGGLTAYDAARTLGSSVTSRVNAYTVGSPVALSEGMYGTVSNVAASWDYVTWPTRAFNGMKETFGGNSAPINTLKTRGGVLKSHLYDKRTYSDAMKIRIDNIRARGL